MEFFAFSETKLNTKHFHTTDFIKHIHELIYPGSVHILSNSPCHHLDIFTNGGNLSLARGKLASRYVSKGVDKYGRYNWLQFYGKISHLRVYNIYRSVSHTDGSAGDNTVWAIQRKLLQDDEIDDDPRSHIISSLVQDIKNDLKQNRLVIIAGDFNQDIFKPSLNNAFSDVGLINVASIFTPNMNARSHC